MADKFARPADSRVMVKICGLRDAAEAIDAAIAGADLLGAVVVPGARRGVTPDAAAVIFSAVKRYAFENGHAPPLLVALTADADNALIDAVASGADMIQLHGLESPERAAAIRARTRRRVAKAVGVGGLADAAAAMVFDGAVDLLVFDAPPPEPDAAASAGTDVRRARGGHGQEYDRSALKAYAGATPFLVAGGLTPENVRGVVDAVDGYDQFRGVDVSSGVERVIGQKDPARVRAFIAAVRGARTAAGLALDPAERLPGDGMA